MKKVLVVVLILIAAAVGFFGRGLFKSIQTGSNSANPLTAGEFLDNPVVYTFTVEGNLKSKTPNSVTLEKDGKQLEISLKDTAAFAKLKNGDISASPSAFMKLDELELGSVIGAAVTKDKTSSELKLLGELFWVK